MNWENIWNTIVNYFKENVWNIIAFFAILFFGIVVIKIIMNIFKKVLRHTRMENIAQQFLAGIIRFILYLIWILLLLSKLGVEITGILTAFSAAVLAIGMALQNNISNLASGIVIVSSKMIKKGDYIKVNEIEGSVVNVSFLFTTLTTFDNKKVTIPNSSLVNNSVINFGANSKRRVDFTFSVAYESDCEVVKKVVLDVMRSNGNIHLDPAPFCRLKTLNTSSIDFFANCWCDSEDYWSVYYYVIETVYNEFKRNKISIPYSQLEIRERKDKVIMPYSNMNLPERIEKQREIVSEKLDLENIDLIEVLKKKRKQRKNSKKDT